MKINLGSGKRKLPQWVNVDADESVRPDVVCRITDYQPDGPVEAVAAIHVLEHLPIGDCVRMCNRIHQWLSTGGRLTVEMPDRAKCFRLAAHPIPKADIAKWDDPAIQGIGGLLGDRPAVHSAWVAWLAEHAAEVLQRVCTGDYTSFLPAQFDSPLENHQHVWSEQGFIAMLRGIGFSFVRAEAPEFHGKRGKRDMRVVAIK